MEASDDIIFGVTATAIRFPRAMPVAVAHVYQLHANAVPQRVLDDLTGRMKSHGPTIEQRASGRRGLVGLHPARA